MTLSEPSACFVFDADLNVVSEPAGIAWPVAVVAELQACVRHTLAAGAESFVLPDDRVQWNVVGRPGTGSRVTVFPQLLACAHTTILGEKCRAIASRRCSACGTITCGVHVARDARGAACPTCGGPSVLIRRRGTVAAAARGGALRASPG